MHDALDIIKGESTRQSGLDAESYMRSLEQFKFTYTAGMRSDTAGLHLKNPGLPVAFVNLHT